MKTPQILPQKQPDGTSTTTEALEAYDLGGVDCALCGNSGTIIRKDEDGVLYSRECDCMPKRRWLRRVRRSGMEDLLARCRFETYEESGEEQKHVLEAATQYAAADEGWFYIAGQSGSGKSHICTAICNALIERNQDVAYMPWRDESMLLKACADDPDRYRARIDRLKRTPVLYIDDFLKGGASDADIRLAFEIINYRYNDRKLRTIVSSETDITALVNRDEALGTRIYERARGYVLTAPKENRRMK